MALNPEHPPSPSKKVFQEGVQQYQNNLQAGFPLWRSNPAGERESGLHMRKAKTLESRDTALKNESVGAEFVHKQSVSGGLGTAVQQKVEDAFIICPRLLPKPGSEMHDATCPVILCLSLKPQRSSSPELLHILPSDSHPPRLQRVPPVFALMCLNRIDLFALALLFVKLAKTSRQTSPPLSGLTFVEILSFALELDEEIGAALVSAC